MISFSPKIISTTFTFVEFTSSFLFPTLSNTLFAFNFNVKFPEFFPLTVTLYLYPCSIFSPAVILSTAPTSLSLTSILSFSISVVAISAGSVHINPISFVFPFSTYPPSSKLQLGFVSSIFVTSISFFVIFPLLSFIKI